MLKKKFVIDVSLNIFAAAIPLLILQLISLPIVGSLLGGQKYGLVVTLISLFSLLSFPFGNVLNNTRLLLNKEYNQKNISGDFNILLAVSIFFSSLMIVFGTVFYEKTFDLTIILLMIIISVLTLVREYLIVTFRLKLNYKAIVVNNIILGIGYLIGTLLFYLTYYWQLIFICGLVSSMLYIIKNSKLLSEPFTITNLFRKASYNSFILLLSSILKSILSYADRLVLFPLIGPKSVAIYYTATVLGKIIIMGVTPINSVMLSYLTRMEKLVFKRFIYGVLLASFFGILGYFLTIYLSYPLLNFLYPNWAEESIKLIYITTASTIIGVVSSVINPFILRFKNINWQWIISGINVVLYFTLSLTFFKYYGLKGFCVGILISNIFKVSLMIAIFTFNYKQVKNDVKEQ